jgi:hypothetical protein
MRTVDHWGVLRTGGADCAHISDRDASEFEPAAKELRISGATKPGFDISSRITLEVDSSWDYCGRLPRVGQEFAEEINVAEGVESGRAGKESSNGKGDGVVTGVPDQTPSMLPTRTDRFSAGGREVNLAHLFSCRQSRCLEMLSILMNSFIFINVVRKVAKTRVFHSEFVKTRERKFFETTSFAQLGGYRKLAACEFYHEFSGAVHPHL